MIYERHEFLSKWLIELGVDEKIATNDACRIEHVIQQRKFLMQSKILLIINKIYTTYAP